MEKSLIKADAMLLLTAIIWGFAFAAQRAGMAHVGPFTYNGLRFALGCLSLLPLWLFMRRRQSAPASLKRPQSGSRVVAWGLGVGVCLFAGASLQQVGIVYTTAGKAGFITGLYVVIVPIIGLFLGQRADLGTGLGAALAAFGLYFLSVTESFTIAFGDLLVLFSAIFWSLHVLLIGWLSRRYDPMTLSILQYVACAVLSLASAFLTETIHLDSIMDAAVPILYGGVMSVGIAYTLQVVAQRHAHPAHAAILLSLESLFAAVGGWIFIGETLSMRAALGCALMLAGMIASQMHLFFLPKAPPKTGSGAKNL